MLSSENRLRKKYEVLNVYKKGRRVRGKYVNLVFKERPRSRIPRFAFSVGTKLEKRATVRNKLKRWSREDVRTLLPRLRPGIDYVLTIVNKPKEHTLLTQDLQDLFNKIH